MLLRHLLLLISIVAKVIVWGRRENAKTSSSPQKSLGKGSTADSTKTLKKIPKDEVTVQSKPPSSHKVETKKKKVEPTSSTGIISDLKPLEDEDDTKQTSQSNSIGGTDGGTDSTLASPNEDKPTTNNVPPPPTGGPPPAPSQGPPSKEQVKREPKNKDRKPLKFPHYKHLKYKRDELSGTIFDKDASPLPSVIANKYVKMFTVDIKAHSETQKSAEDRSGSKVGLGSLDNKLRLRWGVLLATIRKNLLAGIIKGQHKKVYKKPADVSLEDVIDAIIIWDPRLEEIKELPILRPTKTVCDDIEKLTEEQRKLMSELEKFAELMCQVDSGLLENVFKFQEEMNKAREEKETIEKQVTACLTTIKAVLDSKGLRKIVTESVKLLSYIDDNFKINPSEFQGISFAYIWEMDDTKGADKTTLLQLLLEQVNDETAISRLSQEFWPLSLATRTECTDIRGNYTALKATISALEEKLAETKKWEDFEDENRFKYFYSITSREDEIAELSKAMESIGQTVEELQRSLPKFEKYLAYQPLLCPPSEITSQAFSQTAIKTIVDSVKIFTEQCQPGTGKTMILFQVLDSLLDKVANYVKKKNFQKELDEKAKQRKLQTEARLRRVKEQKEREEKESRKKQKTNKESKERKGWRERRVGRFSPRRREELPADVFTKLLNRRNKPNR